MKTKDNVVNSLCHPCLKQDLKFVLTLFFNFSLFRLQGVPEKNATQIRIHISLNLFNRYKCGKSTNEMTVSGAVPIRQRNVETY